MSERDLLTIANAMGAPALRVARSARCRLACPAPVRARRRQRATPQAFQLTHSQFVLLANATWFSAEETLTQARLAQLPGVDAMTTSQVVRTLEAAQLVERLPHPSDPRAKAIYVTEAVRAKARKAIVAVEDTDAAFFEPLGANTRRLVAMLRSSQRHTMRRRTTLE